MSASHHQSADWDRALHEAANWHTRHGAGLSSSDHRKFETWLNASQLHRDAWHDIISTDQVITRLRTARASNDVIAAVKRRQRQSRQRLLWITASVSLAAAAAWVFFFGSAFSPATSPVITETAAEQAIASPLAKQSEQALAVTPPANSELVEADETVRLIKPEVRTLPDGSRMELAVGADAEVIYTPDRREIRLISGDAYFSVMKDPHRPFVVNSGPLSVRAVGTQFAVQVQSEGVNILVTEGQVAVSPGETIAAGSASVAAAVLLTQGHNLDVPGTAPSWNEIQPQTLSESDARQRLAWRRPRILLAGTSLQDVVEYLNRTTAMQVQIHDSAVGNLRLTGACAVDDATEFRQLIEAALPVRSQVGEDGVIHIQTR